LEKEFKIAISIIAIYLIIGFGNLLNFGGFLTPIFLNYSILFLFSIYVLFANLNIEKYLYLYFHTLTIFILLISDGKSISFYNTTFKTEIFNILNEYYFLKLIGILFFLGILLFLEIKTFKNRIIQWLSIILLLGGTISLLKNNEIFQVIFLTFFVFFKIYEQKDNEIKNVYELVYYQSFLLIILENFQILIV